MVSLFTFAEGVEEDVDGLLAAVLGPVVPPVPVPGLQGQPPHADRRADRHKDADVDPAGAGLPLVDRLPLAQGGGGARVVGAAPVGVPGLLELGDRLCTFRDARVVACFVKVEERVQEKETVKRIFFYGKELISS